MGELKPYETTINGATTTVMLTDDDAKARGLTGDAKAADKVEDKQARPVPNKARTASNK